MQNTNHFFFLRKNQRLGASNSFVFPKHFFYDSKKLCFLFFLRSKKKRNAFVFATQKQSKKTQCKKTVKKTLFFFTEQNIFFTKRTLLLFFSIFQKFDQKKIISQHQTALLFFLQNQKNSGKFLKNRNKSTSFEHLLTSFILFQKNRVLNKMQKRNLQNVFFDKKRNRKRFFLNIFLNRNEKISENFQQKFFNFKLLPLPKEDFLFFKGKSTFLFIEFFLQLRFSLFSYTKNFQSFQIQKNFKDWRFANAKLENSEQVFYSNIKEEKQKNTFSSSRNFAFHCFCFFFKRAAARVKKQRFILFPIRKKLFFSEIKKTMILKKTYNLLFSSFSNSFFHDLSPHKNKRKKTMFGLKRNRRSTNFEVLNSSKKKSFFAFQNIFYVNRFSDFIKTYQKIQIYNSLKSARKILQTFFEDFCPLNFLKVSTDFSQNLNNFIITFHQLLKFSFSTVHVKIKNKQDFSTHDSFYNLRFFVSKTKIASLCETNEIHLIRTDLKKTIFPDNQKRLEKFFEQNPYGQKLSFFPFRNKNKSFYISLRFHHFEKNVFHFFRLTESKRIKNDFFTKSVNLKKRDFFPFEIFLFLNKTFQNSLCSLFSIFQSNFSNFILLNDDLLVFFKTKNLLKKTATLFENFTLFKNFCFLNIYQTSIFQPVENCIFLKTKKFQKENQPIVSTFQLFSNSISKNQKQMQNILIFRNIFWVLSKKFVFLQTKLGKFRFFHFCPAFSCFLGFNKMNFHLFFEKNSCGLQNSEKTFVFPTLLGFDRKRLMVESNKNKVIRKKRVETKNDLLFKRRLNSYKHKKFENFLFENTCFQSLNFDGFLIRLILKCEKQLKNRSVFEKKPTREKINVHLKECKRIVKKSIGQKEFSLMRKLHKKIQSWCKKYETISNKQIFDYCDSMVLKFLWNWAQKTHPNKSKLWIRKKYFHLLHSKKWFFGKKSGNRFVCLPLHSQTKTKKTSMLF